MTMIAIDITLRDIVCVIIGCILASLASDSLFGDVTLRFIKLVIKFVFKLFFWGHFNNVEEDSSGLGKFYDVNRYEQSRMAMNCNINTYWMNFGYWKKENDETITNLTFPQACSRMASKLADAVRMKPGDLCLDVGFGCGDQDIWWHQQYGVDIVGVEVIPSQVAVAQRRAADLKIQNRVKLMNGSADDINFPYATFDKIVSLDSAYHYRTRESFFIKSYKLLRPGGSLGLVDLVFNNYNREISILQKIAKVLVSKFFLVPKANMVSADIYTLHMQSAGFRNVKIVDLSEHVFNGFYEFSNNHYKKYSGLIVSRAFIQLRVVGIFMKMIERYTDVKCILAVGNKLSD